MLLGTNLSRFKVSHMAFSREKCCNHAVSIQPLHIKSRCPCCLLIIVIIDFHVCTHAMCSKSNSLNIQACSLTYWSSLKNQTYQNITYKLSTDSNRHHNPQLHHMGDSWKRHHQYIEYKNKSKTPVDFTRNWDNWGLLCISWRSLLLLATNHIVTPIFVFFYPFWVEAQSCCAYTSWLSPTA